MLTSVRGSLRIELCVAFSKAGASTCPNCASFDAWAIAMGRTRPTATASCSGSSITSLSRDNTSISRPTSKVRSCSSLRSTGRTPFGPVPNWGSTFRASSASRPASALRSIPGSSERGRNSRSSVAAADVLTALDQSAGYQTARWFNGALADDLWSHVLVQAPGDLDEQPREQVPIGFDVAQLGEHLFDRVLDFFAPALDLLTQ